MLPGKEDIEIQQGADFEMHIAVRDTQGNLLDFTASTALAQIRSTYSSGTILASFTWTIDVGGKGAKLSMGHLITATIPVQAAVDYKKQLTKYSWDLDVTFQDGTVKRVLEGVALISPSTSRP